MKKRILMTIFLLVAVVMVAVANSPPCFSCSVMNPANEEITAMNASIMTSGVFSEATVMINNTMVTAYADPATLTLVSSNSNNTITTDMPVIAEADGINTMTMDSYAEMNGGTRHIPKPNSSIIMNSSNTTSMTACSDLTRGTNHFRILKKPINTSSLVLV